MGEIVNDSQMIFGADIIDQLALASKKKHFLPMAFPVKEIPFLSLQMLVIS